MVCYRRCVSLLKTNNLPHFCVSGHISYQVISCHTLINISGIHPLLSNIQQYVVFPSLRLHEGIHWQWFFRGSIIITNLGYSAQNALLLAKLAHPHL